MNLTINNKTIRIHDSINILGYQFQIKWGTNEEIQEFLGVRNDNDYGGAINYYQQIILLNKESEQSDESRLETIIHECVHGVSHLMGLDLEEEVVEKLGVGLMTVFKEMTNWIEEEGEE